MRIKGFAGLALGAALLCAPTTAGAATIFGTPVDGANAATGNTSGNEVLYFNPLNCAASGLYGAPGGIGTTTSSGSGCGYDTLDTLDSGSLTMILRFVGATPGAGVLTVDFVDLDLVPVNSSTQGGQPNFFEGIRFFMDAAGTDPFSPGIWELDDVVLPNTVTGETDPPLGGTPPHQTNVTITFPNFVIPSANFNIYLSFGSCSLSQPTFPPLPVNPTAPTCTGNPNLLTRDNTQESLTAKLEFQDPPEIPEPASMMLLGSGLVGLAAKVRGKKRAKAESVKQ